MVIVEDDLLNKCIKSWNLHEGISLTFPVTKPVPTENRMSPSHSKIPCHWDYYFYPRVTKVNRLTGRSDPSRM